MPLDPEELMDLPNLSVVLDKDKTAYQKHHGAWFMTASARKVYAYQIGDVEPLTLLYRPDGKNE